MHRQKFGFVYFTPLKTAARSNAVTVEFELLVLYTKT